MFIFPPAIVLPYLEHECYTTFLEGWELIGFMPCSQKELYYSVGTTLGNIRVVPVFLGHDTSGMCPVEDGGDARWCSDAEYDTGQWNRDHHWVLYFMGCDNGSYSKRCESKEAALLWVLNLQEIEYSQIIYNKDHNLSWVNS